MSFPKRDVFATVVVAVTDAMRSSLEFLWQVLIVAGDRRRNPSRKVRWAGVLALAVAALGACADPVDQSLCPAYEEFLKTGDAIRDVDPLAQSTTEVTKLVEAYLQRITRMQEVADGRYTAELDALETATDDVLRTLASAPDDASSDTWEPLIEDSLGDVRAASARFEEAIEPTCPSDS